MDFNLSAEQKDIKQAAREFAEKEFPPVAKDFDREERFDTALWKKACDLGFVGVFIPETYGGAGMGFLEFCLICEEFWRVDPGCGQAILSATFGSEMLILFGTEAQKQTYLPPLTGGQAIMGTAITEPEAGCDITQASTTAVLEGDQYRINGSKQFITNGTLAKYLVVHCLTHPEAKTRHKRFSALLVETHRPGFEANKIRGKMGIRASDTAELVFKEVRVPRDNLIGKPGEGFTQFMEFFNRTRLHICAQAVGVAQGALEQSVRHVKQRVQFGKTLSSFQVTQFKLAEMATKIEAARSLYYKAAWLTDQGKPDHRLTAMAKWFAGEMAVRVVDEALQLHGGYGYIDEYDVQRFYRDAKILEIYEGTKEMEKTIVAQGLLGGR
jgi:alkylation response protein AidB-like acyl-CoA dehydrogenase